MDIINKELSHILVVLLIIAEALGTIIISSVILILCFAAPHAGNPLDLLLCDCMSNH